VIPLESDETQLKSGLTWKTLLAMLAAVFLFIPLNIYSYFLTGVIQGSVAIFFITILFSEISRLYRTGLSKQEVLILYYASAWGASALPIFYNIIYRAYFVNSPFAESYSIAGKPMLDYIPSWLVPPRGSPAYEVRTLFQPAYLVPVLVWFVWSLLVLVLSISLSLISSYIYVERLNYPFPFALVDISMSNFLSERPREYVKYFLMAFGVGAGFGALAYLPYSAGYVLIPIPYVDLTWILEEVLPGSLLGITTILSSYFSGLIMPFNQALLMVISSIIIWIFLNSLFVTTYPDIFPEWAKEYAKGMGLIAVQNRSFMRVWFAPQIGFMIAVSIFIILFKARKPIIRAFRELFTLPSVEPKTMIGLPSMRTSILLWLGAACLSVIYFHIFVPEVNILIPIVYVFLFGLFVSVSLTAFRGETGYTPPYSGWTWHALVYLTPYQGYSGFIFQPALVDFYAPPSFAQQVKAASVVRAKPKDLLIVWILGSLLAQLSGLISVDFFWRIAPIPSSIYPFTVYGAFSTAYSDAMLVSRQINVSLQTIGIPALILFIILSIGDLLCSKIGIVFPFAGLVMGLYLTPYAALPLFIGSLIGRYVAPRFFGGVEKWRNIVGYVIAGEMSGEGLMLMFNVILALITKSAWLWPW